MQLGRIVKRRPSFLIFHMDIRSLPENCLYSLDTAQCDCLDEVRSKLLRYLKKMILYLDFVDRYIVQRRLESLPYPIPRISVLLVSYGEGGLPLVHSEYPSNNLGPVILEGVSN